MKFRKVSRFWKQDHRGNTYKLTQSVEPPTVYTLTNLGDQNWSTINSTVNSPLSSQRPKMTVIFWCLDLKSRHWSTIVKSTGQFVTDIHQQAAFLKRRNINGHIRVGKIFDDIQWTGTSCRYPDRGHTLNVGQFLARAKLWYAVVRSRWLADSDVSSN